MCSKCKQLLPEHLEGGINAGLNGGSIVTTGGGSIGPSGGSPTGSRPHTGNMGGQLSVPGSPKQAGSPPKSPLTGGMSEKARQRQEEAKLTNFFPDASFGTVPTNLMGSSVGGLSTEEFLSLNPNLNFVSNEDMVLLDRVKWLIKHFDKPRDETAPVAYIVPGKEKRITIEVPPEPVQEEPKEEDGSDSDDDKPKKKVSIEDEMEVTKAKPKAPPKPKVMTAVSWSPGKLVMPEREGILPIGASQEQISTILGPDGKEDTLLPGDPIHEPAGIDPEDTAARMLLGFIGFLQDGDVTTFAPEDRRKWTVHVLQVGVPDL